MFGVRKRYNDVAYKRQKKFRETFSRFATVHESEECGGQTDRQNWATGHRAIAPRHEHEIIHTHNVSWLNKSTML